MFVHQRIGVSSAIRCARSRFSRGVESASPFVFSCCCFHPQTCFRGGPAIVLPRRCRYAAVAASAMFSSLLTLRSTKHSATAPPTEKRRMVPPQDAEQKDNCRDAPMAQRVPAVINFNQSDPMRNHGILPCLPQGLAVGCALLPQLAKLLHDGSEHWAVARQIDWPSFADSRRGRLAAAAIPVGRMPPLAAASIGVSASRESAQLRRPMCRAPAPSARFCSSRLPEALFLGRVKFEFSHQFGAAFACARSSSVRSSQAAR